MNKFLMESGWKAVAQKHKMKDATVQQALAAYANLGAEKLDEQWKALERLGQVSIALKKSKDVLVNGEVGKYLAEVIRAADAEKKQAAAARDAVKAMNLSEGKAGRRGSDAVKRYAEG
jgi:hypothetical protein